MDSIYGFGMHYRNRDPTEKTKRHEALLSVFKAIILVRKGRAFKNLRGIDEI